LSGSNADADAVPDSNTEPDTYAIASSDALGYSITDATTDRDPGSYTDSHTEPDASTTASP
jgi:hypothetical protein